ncbi:YafY family protein [Paenibacillus sp. BC26]|uniref:helix-turn-helix transcriptional regulator n=1 Tax=Paenibacillus sp. BC26 TaxID=1881032 RepID=UPI0008E9273E|nr:YafY family protein [Paenibacillus sp. BC26]SFS47872.1 Predicted DNA-binding transcriptional regulator YafY, contains an HTH and WYL domains [Paenibacillus sp. BC26]
MSKADNMLAILWLLKANKRMTAKQLADSLEMHIRTVYRYIDALCASGVPIVADSGHNGGYSLLEHFKESPLFFDLEEQKALIHAALFAQEAGYPYGDVLKQAVTKLKRYTNEAQRSEIERHMVGFEVVNPSAPPSNIEGFLQQLEQSVASCTTQHMVYQKGYGLDEQERSIDPYGLVHWRGKWYIIAHCHLRQATRSFRVDRIMALNGTDNVFERPEAFSARSFLLRNLKRQPEGEDQLIPIVIKGNLQALNALCEMWLFSEALVDRSVDTARFMIENHLLQTYVPYHLLSFGTRIQVLEPMQLQERLVEIAGKLLQHHSR